MSNTSQESARKSLERLVGEKTGALSPEDTVKTAGDRMRSVDATAWPVAEGRKLVGLIDQNPDRQASGHGHDPHTTRVGDTMRHEAIFCYEDQDAAEADRIMEENRLNHLPVVDRQMKIVGIISRTDVKQDESAPEDWKPGAGHDHVQEVHGADGSRARGSTVDPALYGADGSTPGESQEGEQSAEPDPERFPFRAPADEAEVR